MGTYTLTELQYSDDREGPWKLYIYAEDGKKYEYTVWFAKEPEDEEISVVDAFTAAMEASVIRGQEVRVCDGGDMLVYHAKGSKELYGEHFWRDILKKEKTK